MCHPSCLEFAARALHPDEIRGQGILEVGSFDVNGSVRQQIQAHLPAVYLGVDISAGPGVDEVCKATDLIKRFGEQSWDVVISTEMLEHVSDWRAVVRNLKGVLRLGGILIITTRSKGFMLHKHPIDTFRYELSDMQAIFADMTIELLETDTQAPGVFMKARKRIVRGKGPRLGEIELYRMSDG